MKKKLQKVIARLHLLSASTPNTTVGIQDGSYSVLSVSGTSELNKAYTYYVTFISDEEIEIKDIADTDAKITLKDENSPLRKREIYGKIYHIQESSSVAKKRVYTAMIVSPFYYLTLNKRYKIYQEMSVIDIITQIVSNSKHILNLQVDNKLDAQTFPKRETCIQYGQSDGEFIIMLAQEERFSISFDSSANAPYPMMLSIINEHAKVLPDSNGVLMSSFNRSKKFMPTLQEEDFYDFEDPTGDNFKELGDTVSSQNLSDNDTTTQLRSELKVQTIRDRLEKMDDARINDLNRYVKLDSTYDYSTAETIKGNSESLYTDDGYLAELNEKQTKKTMKAIITSATLNTYFPNALDEYVDENARYKFNVDFEAIPEHTLYTPKEPINKPVVSGVQTAIVSAGNDKTKDDENSIDVDELGRIKVIFHFDEKRPTSCYVRLASMFSGNNWGSQFLPRVNTEVVVSFINGNVDKPLIIGALYNADNTLSHELPDSKTKSYIKTSSMPQYEDEPGYNELLFEDKNSQELLSLRAQKDYKLHALNDSMINIDNDQVKEIGNDETISIGNDQSISILNDKTTSIGNDDRLNVTKDKHLSVGGNHLETVTMNKMESILIAKALSVGAGYQVSVGGAKNETVGLSSTEEVGLLKHIIAGKRFELSVGSSSLILNADGTIILSGKKVLISGSKQVSVNGKIVEIN